MTIDRKRLRELAMAHLRCRAALIRNEKVATEDCLLSDEFAGMDVAAIVVELLDALDRAAQPTDDARDAARYRWLRSFANFDRVDAMLSSMDYHTLDAAVDAAIASQGAKGEDE